MFQVEHQFVLPRGYVDSEGVTHKNGVMRLANAADEIMPMSDARVQQNPAYLTIILLSRVITSLGNLKQVDSKVIEKLFTTDLAYLQDFYQRINQMENPTYDVECPSCGHKHKVPVSFLVQEQE